MQTNKKNVLLLGTKPVSNFAPVNFDIKTHLLN